MIETQKGWQAFWLTILSLLAQDMLASAFAPGRGGI